VAGGGGGGGDCPPRFREGLGEGEGEGEGFFAGGGAGGGEGGLGGLGGAGGCFSVGARGESGGKSACVSARLLFAVPPGALLKECEAWWSRGTSSAAAAAGAAAVRTMSASSSASSRWLLPACSPGMCASVGSALAAARCAGDEPCAVLTRSSCLPMSCTGPCPTSARCSCGVQPKRPAEAVSAAVLLLACP
jgi:hypothetical protein